MATRKDRIEVRNKKIYNQYLTLKNKKLNGICVYTFQAILQMLSIQFFLAPETIEKIILISKTKIR